MDGKRNPALGSALIIDSRNSCDRDEQVQGLQQVFPDAVVHHHGDTEPFYYQHSYVAFEDIRLARISMSGGSFTATHNDSFHLGFVVRGGAEIDSRACPVVTRPFSNANLIRGHDSFTVDVAPHTTSQIIEVDTAALKTRALALFDRELDVQSLSRDFVLTSPAGTALVRSSVAALNELKLLASAGLSQLATVSYSELLINLVLGTIISDGDGSANGGTSRKLADRARDILIARAMEPVRISEVAAALGVSVRSLQMGFKKAFGCSPLSFLFECRLESARIRLQSANAQETVTEIAWACGFIQPSVFAARYRSRFGELPSETLKRFR